MRKHERHGNGIACGLLLHELRVNIVPLEVRFTALLHELGRMVKIAILGSMDCLNVEAARVSYGGDDLKRSHHELFSGLHVLLLPSRCVYGI